jgi:hypothetical protein
MRHPSNPTSRNNVFEALRGLRVKSSKGENLLQVIDSDHGIVIFTTMTNLNFLSRSIYDVSNVLIQERSQINLRDLTNCLLDCADLRCSFYYF